mmetsp:Transcript_13732/g.23335  ORF Transcript_13732/g.23335 Transcript_13732/m.23335 type:complete len:283 (-) Transcript_13732:170-1018(-)
MSSSARPTKKAKKSGQPAAAGPSAIDDLTALTTAQLYSLSAKRHRDYSREIVRMAQEERDRAHVALQEMQSRLERANEHLEKMEENSRDAHREYLDAKNLLIRVRQSSNSTVPPMNIALDDSSVEDILGIISKKPSGNTAASSGKSPGGKKSQKFPYIEDILVSMAKSGQLHKGTKLSLAECHLVNKKDNSQFVNTMKLVEELWTEEEELFLRSSREEIEESMEEAKIIAETISLRCLTKLNEFEGREDPTPTNHQKPSFVSVGNRARRVFIGRKKGDENLV